MITSGVQQIHTWKTQLPHELNPNYLLYLPQAYDTLQSASWPCILFLHGGGERGHDVNQIKNQGLPKLLEHRDDFPFVVVSPQFSWDARWSDESLDTVLNEITGEYRIDADRVYVTGMSMGGYGTWSLALAYPQRFAAIAPICGGGDPDRVCVIKHLPVWNFHGARDTVVPLECSEVIVEALKRCGGIVRFTVYPEAGHDSWTETYNNPELYSWLLEHSRIGGQH